MAKKEGGTTAKENSDQKESGDNTPTPISRIEATYREDQNSLLLGIKRKKSHPMEAQVLPSRINRVIILKKQTHAGPIRWQVVNQVWR